MMLSDKLRQEKADAIIWTEGKTDWKHLKKAKEQLNLGLNIEFNEYEDKDMGDDALAKRCKTFAETSNPIPIILIFDNDNEQIVKQVVDPDKKYKNWGNNVFSFAIPTPSHREGYENICIEFYYTDEELITTDTSGRRLFLTHEFDEKSGTHIHDDTIHIGNVFKLKGVTTEKKTKIVDSDMGGVYKKGKSILLSKSDFANNICDDNDTCFNDFKFEEFRKIFEIIEAIIQDTQPKINIWFPDEDQLFNKLRVEDTPSKQFGDIFECIINLLEMVSHIFSISTIRFYEDRILDEPKKHRKKVSAIKEIITKRFLNPTLPTFYELTGKCYYLTDMEAPEELQNMKACLEKTITLGAIGELLDDLEKKIFLIDAKEARVVNKPQTKQQLFKDIMPQFSEYANKLPQLREKIEESGDELNLNVKVWLEALRMLLDLVAPMFSNTFVYKTSPKIDAGNNICSYDVRTYRGGRVEFSEENMNMVVDEIDGFQSDIFQLLMTKQGTQIRINLFPFFIIKNDKLYFYKRTKTSGYEYISFPDKSISTFETRTKFNHSVFKSKSMGGQQALFWIKTTPSINQVNKVKANYPKDGLDNFVGRREYIKAIKREIIELINENGIVYGPGGVGKTALMQQLSKELFDEKNPADVIHNNIIWVSAKSTFYHPAAGVVEKKEKQFTSLDNIFTMILYFFGFEDAVEYDVEDKKELMLELLYDNKVLLYFPLSYLCKIVNVNKN